MNEFITSKVVDAQIALREDETGATAVEYGIMVALIAAVIIGAVLLLGTEVLEAFTDVTDVMPNAN